MRTWKKAEGPMWQRCGTAMETPLIPSYNRPWLSRSGLNMTVDVTGDEINTQMFNSVSFITAYLEHLLILGAFFTFPWMFLQKSFFYLLQRRGWGWGDPGKPAFKLFSPAHRWIRGWTRRFAVRTRMHCCSLTSQLEGLIRDVHHCVTFCMQTSFLLTLSACLLTFPLASTSKTARKTRFVCRLEVG